MRNLLILILFITSQITYTQSNEALKRKIKTDSTTAIFYYDRSVDKIESKDYNGALKDFDEAIKFYSRNADYFHNRAYIKDILEDFIGAIEDYTVAIMLNPNDYTSYNNRAFKILF